MICFLLYQLTQVVDSYFLAKPLPEQYTARNIAVLVQTVVRGLAYLITFIFGANALGLTGEGGAAWAGWEPWREHWRRQWQQRVAESGGESEQLRASQCCAFLGLLAYCCLQCLTSL